MKGPLPILVDHDDRIQKKSRLLDNRHCYLSSTACRWQCVNSSKCADERAGINWNSKCFTAMKLSKIWSIYDGTSRKIHVRAYVIQLPLCSITLMKTFSKVLRVSAGHQFIYLPAIFPRSVVYRLVFLLATPYGLESQQNSNVGKQ